MSITFSDTIESRIRAAIVTAAQELTEEIVEGAVAQFEQDLRARIGQVAVGVSNYFSVQRMGNDLVIHVRQEKPNGQ